MLRLDGQALQTQIFVDTSSVTYSRGRAYTTMVVAIGAGCRTARLREQSRAVRSEAVGGSTWLCRISGTRPTSGCKLLVGMSYCGMMRRRTRSGRRGVECFVRLLMMRAWWGHQRLSTRSSATLLVSSRSVALRFSRRSAKSTHRAGTWVTSRRASPLGGMPLRGRQWTRWRAARVIFQWHWKGTSVMASGLEAFLSGTINSCSTSSKELLRGCVDT